MTHGGARVGAGRPKGRPTNLADEARREALEGGISPLEYLLSVMRNDAADESKRIDAAKAAAPYVHARLNAMALTDSEFIGPAKLEVTWIRD